MDERFSKNKKRYVTVDFSNVTPQGLKELVTAFNRTKQKVADVMASNRVSRKNGQKQKLATFVFENGQTVKITFTDEGDIALTKLNRTIIPVNDVSSVAAYTREVASAMKSNQAKFDKALARKASAVIKDTSSTKPASRSLVNRIAEAKEALATANSNLNESKKTLAAVSMKHSTSVNEKQELELKLNQLKAEENQLIERIEELGGEI